MKKIITSILVFVAIASYSQDRYEVVLAGFNSEVSDFGPSYTADGLIFSSERDTATVAHRRHRINGKLRPYLQLFSVKKDDPTEVDRLKTVVNKKYHESTVSITNDGNTMYFTRNNYYSGKLKKNGSDVSLLKLFRAVKATDGGWENVVELAFNSDDYSVAHPTLNADNSRLYFASDMPGTLGKSDIWYVSIAADGTYDTPVNMGGKINTTGSDTFPFMAKSGDLYFSSDTHTGNGGLDIFVAKKDEEYTVIHNLGASINTVSDDFSLIFNEVDRTGYFSSNRKNGVGDDDIYEFKELEPLIITCEGILSGTTKDENGVVVAYATVVLTDVSGKEMNSMQSDSSGNYSFDIDCKDQSYTVTGTKVSYEQDAKIASATIGDKTSQADLVLKSIDSGATVGTDLVEELNLNPIYFDTNKSTIRPDAALELKKVIVYMQKYPDVNVEVRSHTDSRGNDSYNLNLSKKRNKSIVDYIVNIGSISKQRVSGKGYGESKLINKCSNGVKCSKEQHERNRRSEFIISSN